MIRPPRPRPGSGLPPRRSVLPCPAKSKKRRKREQRRDRFERRALRLSPPQAVRPAPRDAAEPICGVEPMRIDPALSWYIARLLPRFGERALKALKEAEVARFQPRVDRVIVIRGRRVVHSAQLLPRTVFIGVRDDIHLAEARGVPGLAEIVSHLGPEPAGAPKGNIDGLVMRPTRLDPVALQDFADAVASGEIVAPMGVSEGSAVVVQTGPFASFPGVVEAILPGDRVKVAVSIFGRVTPVEVGLADVAIV